MESRRDHVHGISREADAAASASLNPGTYRGQKIRYGYPYRQILIVSEKSRKYALTGQK